MSQHLCFNPYNRTLDNGNSNVVLSFKLPVSITILDICTLIYIESDCFVNGDQLWLLNNIEPTMCFRITAINIL